MGEMCLHGVRRGWFCFEGRLICSWHLGSRADTQSTCMHLATGMLYVWLRFEEYRSLIHLHPQSIFLGSKPET